jgi:hypothetical protein
MIALASSITMARLYHLHCLLAEDDPRPLLERLSPTQRAAVLAALFALVLLGMALVAFVYLGGRFVRRQNRRRPPERRPLASDWDRKQPAEKKRPEDQE